MFRLLKNSYFSGLIAEKITKIYLVLCGFRIVKSRFVVGNGTGAGEIDIIAVKRNLLVFVEVKKRASVNLAKEAIFLRQKKRIYRSAEVFLSKNPKYLCYDCRFDAVCFNKFYFFDYIKNAFGLDI